MHICDGMCKAGNPSFIIPSPDRHFAYAVSEYSDGREGVYSFALNEDRIDMLNFRDGTGADPCNIVAVGESVITSDYSGSCLHSGLLAIWPKRKGYKKKAGEIPALVF